MILGQPSSQGQEFTKHLLCVEADHHKREVYRKMLEGLGLVVEAKPNGLEGWHTFLENPDRWAMVVTASHIPLLSGAEMIRMIKKLRPDMPVILFTKQEDKDSGDSAHLLADRVVNKAYPLDLLSVVKWYLQ